MIENIIIFLILFILMNAILSYKDGFSQTTEDQRNCSIFGCPSERANENRIELLETDIVNNKTNDKQVENKTVIENKVDNYTFVGKLVNEEYRLEYLLYEKPYDKDNKLDEKIYYYKLVKVIDGKYKTYYEIPPRNKIQKGEFIWITYGNINLGPLLLR
jgi:hypothetical protein